MGSVIWQRPVRLGDFAGTARAIRYTSGKVSFELSERMDGLGVPQWEPSPFIPEEFLTCAAAIMADSLEETVILAPEEVKPLAPRGEWILKRRKPGIIHRLGRMAGAL